MKMSLDTERRTVVVEDEQGVREIQLYSTEAFAALSRVWVNTGWELKYTYGFSWLGRPIIQLPEDMVRVQEVVFDVRPDIVIETGVAHGGSLVFYASLLRSMGTGRVIGIDIEIRPPNREAIEAHPLAPLITLIDGSSTDPAVVDRVKALIRPEDRVLVVLDSNHTRRHVRDELEAYAPLVTPDSYIVVADGVLEDLADVPRGKQEWAQDNPKKAAEEFLLEHPEFVPVDPPIPFNEGSITAPVTHWPSGYLRRSRTPQR